MHGIYITTFSVSLFSVLPDRGYRRHRSYGSPCHRGPSAGGGSSGPLFLFPVATQMRHPDRPYEAIVII